MISTTGVSAVTAIVDFTPAIAIDEFQVRVRADAHLGPARVRGREALEGGRHVVDADGQQREHVGAGRVRRRVADGARLRVLRGDGGAGQRRAGRVENGAGDAAGRALRERGAGGDAQGDRGRESE